MNYTQALNILDLTHDFTKKELKSKYRIKCLETHPDKNKDKDSSCKQDFILVKEAYEFLSNEENIRKEKYESDNKTRKNTILGYMLYFFGIFLNLLLHHLKNESKTIILKPTIHDILMKNLYKLEINSEIYYIPLWCDNVYIKQHNILVKIEKPKAMHYKYEEVKDSKHLYYKHLCIERSLFISISQNIERFNNICIENKQKIINIGIPQIKKVFDYEQDIEYMFHNMNTYSNIELL